MATQQDALLELLIDVTDFLHELPAKSPKHTKAKEKLINKFNKTIARTNAKIAAYNAKREKSPV